LIYPLKQTGNKPMKHRAQRTTTPQTQLSDLEAPNKAAYCPFSTEPNRWERRVMAKQARAKANKPA
jgi:hypothetical protein